MPIIYYKMNQDDDNQVHYISESDYETFEILEEGYAVVTNSAGSTYLCKYHNDQWVLHSDSSPALVNKSMSAQYFFFNGINYTIEDMPIDDEIKVILLLKYGYKCNKSKPWYTLGFEWYRLL